ncbi:hypothetical protein M433DRAFT_159300 [Acidomyces richmondensis BFW]|nr:MAG: hypothetical protein FE78DRAFT_94665 [Acidomyces sp. 'richmondensis']KYG41227.1 hypothetical protein M433DRAFT_159300 [Acidomyces richmondensis BFW]
MASSEFSDDDIIDADIDVDSEVESMFADSPSDGYFTSRNHPQETFVENSTVLAESDAKAREAAENQASQNPAARLPSPTSSGPNIWPVESTPLLDDPNPPPDYAAAISHGRHATSNISPAGTSNGGGSSILSSPRYGSTVTMANHQRSSSSQGHLGRPWLPGDSSSPFVPNSPHNFSVPTQAFFNFASGGTSDLSRPPQVMADSGPRDANDGSSDEEVGLLHGFRSERRGRHGHKWKKTGRHMRNCCRPLSLLNILLACVIISIIVNLLKEKKQSNNGGGDNNPNFGDRQPETPRTGGDVDQDDSDSDSRNRTWPPHPGNARCPYTHYTEAHTFGFWPNDTFSLIEDINFHHTDVTGNMWLLPAPVEQQEPVQISINYATIENFPRSRMHYEHSDNHFTVKMADSNTAPKSCMDVAIIMYVRNTLKLNHLAISTSHLNVEAGKGIFSAQDTGFHVSVANIATGSGHVKADYWSSRKTCIQTTSGSIRGVFAQLDLLNIQSRSGSVNIDVLPKDMSEKSPAPAAFSVITTSGSIQARYPLKGNLPERDYRTHIESHSGSLSGDYIHGSLTTFDSNSGSIKVNVLPFYAEHRSGSVLRTNGYSGQQKIVVLPPYSDKVFTGEYDVPTRRSTSDVLNKLKSSHTSTSGFLDLSYPQVWEGVIEGETTSGSITVRGNDVRKWGEYDIGMGRHRLLARKGLGTSTLDFLSTSGSVLIKFGED